MTERVREISRVHPVRSLLLSLCTHRSVISYRRRESCASDVPFHRPMLYSPKDSAKKMKKLLRIRVLLIDTGFCALKQNSADNKFSLSLPLPSLSLWIVVFGGIGGRWQACLPSNCRYLFVFSKAKDKTLNTGTKHNNHIYGQRISLLRR